jgi:arylsulfatase A-like enzyme
VVFLVDTLRRDHLSLYGYPRATSPQLARFGAGALVFDNAWTQSSWTNPAVASLFTGEHPSAHGIHDHHGQVPAAFLTVAEFLKAKGYQTAAVVANPGMGTQAGFSQGFDSFEVRASAKAGVVVDAGLARVGPRPFFLYLHVMDSHYPYRAAPSPFDALVRRPEWPPVRPAVLSMANLRKRKIVPTPAELDYLTSMYDSQIASLDDSFGRLLQGLKDRGLFDSTVIVFLSDHGEEFTDHGGYYHGDTLYSELTRAAMVIKPAGAFTPRSVHAPAQTIDVYPTLVGAIGESPEALPGHDLLQRASTADEAPVFSETDLRVHLKSVVLRNHKLVLQDRRSEGVADTPWLFDLETDPGEHTNRRGREPIRTEYLASLLRRHLESQRQRSSGPERRELSEETVRELQALGYLGAAVK